MMSDSRTPVKVSKEDVYDVSQCGSKLSCDMSSPLHGHCLFQQNTLFNPLQYCPDISPVKEKHIEGLLDKYRTLISNILNINTNETTNKTKTPNSKSRRRQSLAISKNLSDISSLIMTPTKLTLLETPKSGRRHRLSVEFGTNSVKKPGTPRRSLSRVSSLKERKESNSSQLFDSPNLHRRALQTKTASLGDLVGMLHNICADFSADDLSLFNNNTRDSDLCNVVMAQWESSDSSLFVSTEVAQASDAVGVVEVDQENTPPAAPPVQTTSPICTPAKLYQQQNSNRRKSRSASKMEYDSMMQSCSEILSEIDVIMSRKTKTTASHIPTRNLI